MKKHAVYGFFCVSLALLFLVLLGLGSALSPLLAAWILAYLCIPLFKAGERHGVPKAVSALIILFMIICIFIAVLFVLIPYLISELQFFLSDFPQFVVDFMKQVTTVLATYDVHIEIDDFSLLSFIKAHLPSVSAKSLVWVGSAFQSALSNIIHTILRLITLFIFPVFFFYVSISYDTINQTLQTWIPPRYWQRCAVIEEEIDEVLGGFIRGQMIIASILALYYSLSLSLIQLKSGIVIGFCTGLLSLIPYVGFSIGLFSALVVATASGASTSLIIAILAIFLFAYLIDSFFLTPKLVGERVGLNSLSVMLALIVGGNWYGLWGMLLAIPTAALVKRAYTNQKASFQTSRWYRKGI